MKSKRRHTEIFRKFGLDVMKKCGKPLTKQSNTKALIYELANGESVRLKTNKNRVLIAKTDGPNIDAKQNLEVTNWILLVMPEVKGALDPVAAYLLPTSIVVDAFRSSHGKWLANPDTKTKGTNMTWVLRFDGSHSGRSDKNELYGYADRWNIYRLKP